MPTGRSFGKSDANWFLLFVTSSGFRRVLSRQGTSLERELSRPFWTSGKVALQPSYAMMPHKVAIWACIVQFVKPNFCTCIRPEPPFSSRALGCRAHSGALQTPCMEMAPKILKALLDDRASVGLNVTLTCLQRRQDSKRKICQEVVCGCCPCVQVVAGGCTVPVLQKLKERSPKVASLGTVHNC